VKAWKLAIWDIGLLILFNLVFFAAVYIISQIRCAVRNANINYTKNAKQNAFSGNVLRFHFVLALRKKTMLKSIIRKEVLSNLLSYKFSIITILSTILFLICIPVTFRLFDS